MNVDLKPLYAWSIGTSAKAKYFTAEKQNEDDVYYALREIVFSNHNRLVASFTTFIKCIDNPKLSGSYDVSLYFNDSGDTFFKLEWTQGLQIINLRKLQNKDSEKYRAFIQGLFEAIVTTREFKQFARKATNNIQDCFKDVIDPLYKGELRVSDELEPRRGVNLKVTKEDVRKAVNDLIKIKTRIVSSAILNLSQPELKNM